MKIYIAAALTVLVLISLPLYKLKSRAGINIFPGGHTPKILERITHGLFKASWVDKDYLKRP